MTHPKLKLERSTDLSTGDNMQTLEQQKVRDLASTHPGAARIFEKFGIDYCCGGDKSLAEACSAAKIDLGQVTGELEKPQVNSTGRDWQNAPLQQLTRYIVERHHGFVRQEISRLLPLFIKVIEVHGNNHPELRQIHNHFQSLTEELTLHLMKEERMLFPYIDDLEAAANCGARAAAPMFGTVQNPVRMMMMEHDSAGELLREMRKATNGYALPEGACMSFRMLYNALEEFETDLHQHIHLENNILFPRAIALESRQLV
jgi:regulator of cell morphogenesis and NO signaling